MEKDKLEITKHMVSKGCESAEAIKLYTEICK